MELVGLVKQSAVSRIRRNVMRKVIKLKQEEEERDDGEEDTDMIGFWICSSLGQS